MRQTTQPLSAGVIGVGNMGRHHARVYREMPNVDLVGVADIDQSKAAEIAEQYQTRPMQRDALLDAVDLVSIAVPTSHHYKVSREAIDHGVHLLVEKPFVDDPSRAMELVARARAAGLTLQVGHIERFNPAIVALQDILPDLEIIAISASRLGPPLNRYVEDDVIMDLMIHDVDILLSVVDTDVTRIDASTTEDGQYAMATVTFESGVIGTLTASRVTQQKVRTLSVTARECQVNLDFAEQSVRIHRQSVPSYVEDNGGLRYRYESVTERPSVANGEPLRRELEAFTQSVRTGEPPIVDGEDGLRAVAFAERIRRMAKRNRRSVREVQTL